MKTKNILFLGISLLVFAADQLTKQLIKTHFLEHESIQVIGDFFRLTFIYNENAAFGISLGSKFPYSIVSILVIGMLFYLYYAHGRHHILTAISLGMILGGALGNLIDRMILKKVVDFFDFEFFNIIIPSFKIAGFQFSGYEMYRWPIFNIADIGISVGVIALFILIWFEESQPEEFQEEGVSKIEQPIL